MDLYRPLLRVGIIDSKMNDPGSNTDSKSDEPVADDQPYISEHELWPTTSDPGNKGLTGPTSCLPGYVGGAANGLVTQPDATTTNDDTETTPRTAAP